MRAYRGEPFLLDRHLTRFVESCRSLGLSPGLSRHSLRRWIQKAYRESRIQEASLRLMLNQYKEDYRLTLMVRPFKKRPLKDYQQGITLRSVATRRNTPESLNPRIKSSQYVNGVLAFLEGEEKSPHTDYLFLNKEGMVTEGTTSNLFFLKGESLVTSPLWCGVLEGVTRGVVMDLAGRLGLAVKEVPITRHDLYNADEVFLTNTSVEILPVTTIDSRRIGRGLPGVWTVKFLQAFKESIRQEEGLS